MVDDKMRHELAALRQERVRAQQDAPKSPMRRAINVITALLAAGIVALIGYAELSRPALEPSAPTPSALDSAPSTEQHALPSNIPDLSQGQSPTEIVVETTQSSPSLSLEVSGVPADSRPDGNAGEATPTRRSWGDGVPALDRALRRTDRPTLVYV